jgi:hypothetical protein
LDAASLAFTRPQHGAFDLDEITPIICIALPAGVVASARQRPDGADDRPEQERPAEKVDVLMLLVIGAICIRAFDARL